MMFMLLGVAAGALTGVPIGPANVAVIDAAYRHTMRRAMAVAFGAAFADGLYSALGAVVIAPLLRSHPILPPVFYAVSGVLLLVYGYYTARARPQVPVKSSACRDGEPSNDVLVGMVTGVALIVLNPAALVTWVVIMTSILPVTSTVNGLVCAFGVMAGSLGWFTLVAQLTQRGKHVLGEKAAWIPRVIGIALMVYAVYLIARAVNYVIA